MSIARDAYLRGMATQNRHGLAETALELVDLFNESDPQQRRDLGRDLVNEFYRVLTQVHAWKPYEAKFAAQAVAKAFKEVRHD